MNQTTLTVEWVRYSFYVIRNRVNEPIFDRAAERFELFDLSLLHLLLYSHVLARDDIYLWHDWLINDGVDDVADKFLPLHHAIAVYVNVLE